MAWVFLVTIPAAHAQSVPYFREGDNPGYDSRCFVNAGNGSTLSNIGGKIPVTSTIPAYRGSQSMQLTYTAQAGGYFVLQVVQPGFARVNLTLYDTLSFALYTQETIAANVLPRFRIHIENSSGTTFSKYYNIGDYTAVLPLNTWRLVKLPVTAITSDPANAGLDFANTLSIDFEQNQSDTQSHTLYIDELKVYKQLMAPAISAVGYDSHAEINFSPAAAASYRLLRSADGSTYQPVKNLSVNDTITIDWVNHQAVATPFYYRLVATDVNDSDINSAPSSPAIATVHPLADSELLDMAERYTFRYFWDFAHPVSGMIREGTQHDPNIVTSGGTGFGIMCITAAAYRNYIPRAAAVTRIKKICDFLGACQRYSGIWSHWYNGSTGQSLEFAGSSWGDIVETSFVVQGLLTAKKYFNGSDSSEVALRAAIDTLWLGVDWTAHVNPSDNKLYWGYDPVNGYQLQAGGFNEAMLAYIIGASSPTHPLPASLYYTSWAWNESSYHSPLYEYGHGIEVGDALHLPAFIAQYCYMGLDPHFLRDKYCRNYFERNKAHTLIHKDFCVANPNNRAAYSEQFWGITASTGPSGYVPFDPGNENGTIAPTAAIGSLPYTPEASLAALKYFYREQGDSLWNVMGFYDAINPSQNWVSPAMLAIDQGPIMIMIENYRSQLLWNSFMQNTEITAGLAALNIMNSPVAAPAVKDSMILWLKADTGLQGAAGNITGWLDQSGSGNNMTKGGASTLSIVSNALNGHPAMHIPANNGGAYLSGLFNNALTGEELSAYIVTRSSATSGIYGVAMSVYKQGIPDKEETDTSSAKLFARVAGATYLNAKRQGSTGIADMNFSDSLNVENGFGIFSAHFEKNNGYASTNANKANRGIYSSAPFNADRFLLGRSVNTWDGFYYDGDIAEVILFKENKYANGLTKRIESYLALKYGIAQDVSESGSYHYFSSDGTVIWNNIASKGFKGNIAGIGRDDAWGLDQRTTASSMPAGDIVTISNGAVFIPPGSPLTDSFSTDRSFALWGNNQKFNAPLQTVTAGALDYQATPRIWKMQLSAHPGTVSMRFVFNHDSIPGVQDHSLYSGGVLVADDSLFSSNVVFFTGTYTGDTVIANAVQLSNGQYFRPAFTLSVPLALAGIQLTGVWKDPQTAQLNWQTVTGETPHLFLVQKSTDERSFTTVDSMSVEAATLRTFNFTDRNYTKTSYYRIQQTTVTGKGSYSNTVCIRQKPAEWQASLAPNPAAAKLGVQSNQWPVTVTLYSMHGQALLQTTLRAGGALIDIEGLSQGMYMVQLKLPGNEPPKNIPLIKQ